MGSAEEIDDLDRRLFFLSSSSSSSSSSSLLLFLSLLLLLLLVFDFLYRNLNTHRHRPYGKKLFRVAFRLSLSPRLPQDFFFKKEKKKENREREKRNEANVS